MLCTISGVWKLPNGIVAPYAAFTFTRAPQAVEVLTGQAIVPAPVTVMTDAVGAASIVLYPGAYSGVVKFGTQSLSFDLTVPDQSSASFADCLLTAPAAADFEIFTATTRGLVPASGGVPGTFLAQDATFRAALQSFATRAEAVTEATAATPPAGAVIQVADLQWRFVSYAVTTIPDMPGWVPQGQVRPDHYADNASPGTTNMLAAINAALAFSKDVYLRGTTYFVSGNVTDLIHLAAGGNAIYGVGAAQSKIVGQGSHPSICYLIEKDAPLVISGVTLQVTATGQSSAHLMRIRTSNLILMGCLLDGQVVYTSGSPNQIGYGLSFSDTGTQDNILCVDCEFTRLHWPLFKKGSAAQIANAATSTQDNLRFVRCQYYGNFREDLGFNSPKGAMTNVVVKDCHFRDHAGTAAGITDSRMYITFASVTGAVVEGNTFKSTIQQCVHIEYGCKRITVTGNTAYCDFPANGGFCHISANNTDGTNRAPNDITVTGNTCEAVSVNTASTGVWVFNNNYTGTPQSLGIVVTGNSMIGLDYGYYIDNESNGAVKVSGNIARSCTHGYRGEQDTSFFENNISADCTYGVNANGASFTDHTFVNCTDTVYSTSTNIGGMLFNPKWIFRQFVAVANTITPFILFPVQADTRAHGFLTAMGISETNNRRAMSRWEVTWDGTTLTQVQKVFRNDSSVTLTLDTNANNLRARYFENAPATLNNATMSVVFQGAISLRL